MKRLQIIDENGRLFGLISMIDVAVILVAVVVSVAVYFKFNTLPQAGPSAAMDRITYQLTITNMPEGRLQSIKVGDLLYDDDNDTRVAIGEIKNIEAEECYIPSTLLDGTYVMGHVEGRYNVVLTIQAEGIVDANGRTYINRINEVELGMVNNFYTKACYFSATVTQLINNGV